MMQNEAFQIFRECVCVYIGRGRFKLCEVLYATFLYEIYNSDK